tara:strand:+ start:130 stop:522 length:393 start_codon:yes stop_codon:yes gene_type:complete
VETELQALRPQETNTESNECQKEVTRFRKGHVLANGKNAMYKTQKPFFHQQNTNQNGNVERRSLTHAKSNSPPRSENEQNKQMLGIRKWLKKYYVEDKTYDGSRIVGAAAPRNTESNKLPPQNSTKYERK